MATRDGNKINKRNSDIVKRFNELLNKKTVKGAHVHSYAYCIETVAEEFYLTERWVAEIIRNHNQNQ